VAATFVETVVALVVALVMVPVQTMTTNNVFLIRDATEATISRQ